MKPLPQPIQTQLLRAPMDRIHRAACFQSILSATCRNPNPATAGAGRETKSPAFGSEAVCVRGQGVGCYLLLKLCLPLLYI